MAKLFLDNADKGCNAENDALVEELLKRRRAIQLLANPQRRMTIRQRSGALPETTRRFLAGLPRHGDPVGAVWNRLGKLERAGYDSLVIDALRAVLLRYQPPRYEHRDDPHAWRGCRGGPGDAGGRQVTAADAWDLLVWIVLSRVHDGGVTRQHGDYFDRDLLAPNYLAGLFFRLTDTGSLALADPDPTGRQQVTITDAGHARYAQLRSAVRQVPPLA